MRNAVILALTAFIMVGLYRGGYWVLSNAQSESDFAYLQSSVLLGLILVFLLLMLLVTNTAAALGTLFMGSDLPLVLSSPLSPRSFFSGKFSEILVSSSWMTAVFLFPLIVLFGSFYNTGLYYYVLATVVFVPYFCIPAACSIILACLLSALIPIRFKREAFVVFIVLTLFAIYFLGTSAGTTAKEVTPIDVADILRAVSFLSVTDRQWSPSYWVARILGEALEPSGQEMSLLITLLYSTMFACLSLSYLFLRCMHLSGYSWASGKSHGRKINSAISQSRINRFLRVLRPQTRALLVKEYKTNARDFTQSTHAFLLIGICALYLYMLSFQHLFRNLLPVDQQQWWKLFLLSANSCVEAFLITAIGTRFVFPSISREGRSYWSLSSGPISIKKLLWIKYLVWLSFVLVCTGVVFGTATISLFASFPILLGKLFLNFINCIGLVALGVGCGAYFVNFHWQHPSQLTSGFGTLVYMLISVFLIVLNLTISAIALYMAHAKAGWSPLQYPGPFFLSVGLALFYVLVNLGVAWWALGLGVTSLEAHVQDDGE